MSIMSRVEVKSSGFDWSIFGDFPHFQVWPQHAIICSFPHMIHVFLPYTSRMAALQKDDFNEKSAAFLNWLQGLQGVRVSTKIHIADMRSRAAGRGIGTVLL